MSYFLANPKICGCSSTCSGGICLRCFASKQLCVLCSAATQQQQQTIHKLSSGHIYSAANKKRVLQSHSLVSGKQAKLSYSLVLPPGFVPEASQHKRRASNMSAPSNSLEWIPGFNETSFIAHAVPVHPLDGH